MLRQMEAQRLKWRCNRCWSMRISTVGSVNWPLFFSSRGKQWASWRASASPLRLRAPTRPRSSGKSHVNLVLFFPPSLFLLKDAKFLFLLSLGDASLRRLAPERRYIRASTVSPVVLPSKNTPKYIIPISGSFVNARRRSVSFILGRKDWLLSYGRNRGCGSPPAFNQLFPGSKPNCSPVCITNPSSILQTSCWHTS